MKITFDFSRKQVGIEGDGPELVALLQLVRDAAPRFTEIRIVTESNSVPPPDPVHPRNGSEGDQEKLTKQRVQGWQTLREFARSLAPSNMAERIAVIGFYVAKYEGKPSFSPKDMGEWFGVCGFEKPSQMAVAIFDSKRKYGYLENVGHGDWRLTSAGENVVIRKIEENGSR